MKYLLPCQCSLHIPIDVSQAGQSVVCQCGQVVEVPTMREVRQLPSVEEESDTREKPAWTRRQGVLFVSGMSVALVASLVALYCWNWRSALYVKEPIITEASLNRFYDEIDEMPIDVFLEEWSEVTGNGLGPWYQHPYLTNRKTSAGLLNCTIGASIVGAIAFALGIGAVFMTPK